jgi:hypothetical protein
MWGFKVAVLDEFLVERVVRTENVLDVSSSIAYLARVRHHIKEEIPM